MIFWIGAGLFVAAGGLGGQWWYLRVKRRCRLLTELRRVLMQAVEYIKNVGGDKRGFWETIEGKTLFQSVSHAPNFEINPSAAALLSEEELAAFTAIDKAFCAQSADAAEQILQKAIVVFPEECSSLLKKANAQRVVAVCSSVLLVLLLL